MGVEGPRQGSPVEIPLLNCRIKRRRDQVPVGVVDTKACDLTSVSGTLENAAVLATLHVKLLQLAVLVA